MKLCNDELGCITSSIYPRRVMGGDEETSFIEDYLYICFNICTYAYIFIYKYKNEHFNVYISGLNNCIVYFRFNSKDVRFQVFTAVTMKNGVFWDVTPCGSCKNRGFGGT
jgi:hypothetical protein